MRKELCLINITHIKHNTDYTSVYKSKNKQFYIYL